MTRRRALLIFGGVLLALGAGAVALRREIQAAWRVHRLHTALDWRDRANAAIELGRLKVRRTAPDLVKRLKDPSHEVRKNCEWALAQVTGLPWGQREGPAPDWWNKYGKDFVLGNPTPMLPRVEVPPVTKPARYLEVSARLEEDRVYNLGDTDDMMMVIVTLRNKTDKPLFVLHPPWEEYSAYEYHADGTKAAVDVRPYPPSSVCLACTRTGRELAGPVTRTAEQFSVLPDQIPANGSADLEFQIVVTRDRPGVLFEQFTLAASITQAVLEAPEGIVTEEPAAPPLTAYAWASGKGALEQLGLEAQEVARSGREVLGVAYGKVAVHASPGALDAPVAALGWAALFPAGTLAWSKPCGWMEVRGPAPADGPMIVAQDVSSAAKESWILVTDRK